MPERFKVVLDHARRYTSARLYLFLPLSIFSFKVTHVNTIYTLLGLFVNHIPTKLNFDQ